jgi:signal transduction histidine kinase
MLIRHGIRLAVIIEENLPPILGNADELTQVLCNLLTNAKNHSGADLITLSAGVDAGFIRLAVADKGAGIVPGLLPDVFEKHIHGENAGTGLGLFICREIAASHGGSINMESERGNGTTVTILLPEYKEGRDNG